MVLNNKGLLTIMLSTIFVLSIQSQYYVQKLLVDEVRKGELISISQTADDNFLIHLSIVYNKSNIYSDIILNESKNSSITIIKDFYPPDQWMYFWGRSLKHEGNTFYYSSRDILFNDIDTNNVGWNYGKVDFNGNQLISKKIPIKLWRNKLLQSFGIEIVKNDEVILWGIGHLPTNSSTINDPHISWIRLKKDGTLVSGPHYYKPPAVTT